MLISAALLHPILIQLCIALLLCMTRCRSQPPLRFRLLEHNVLCPENAASLQFRCSQNFTCTVVLGFFTIRPVPAAASPFGVTSGERKTSCADAFLPVHRSSVSISFERTLRLHSMVHLCSLRWFLHCFARLNKSNFTYLASCGLSGLHMYHVVLDGSRRKRHQCNLSHRRPAVRKVGDILKHTYKIQASASIRILSAILLPLHVTSRKVPHTVPHL